MNQDAGRVEVICGPMFAGKTEELLRRVRRATIAGRDVRLFTHTLDSRSGPGRAASHIGIEQASVPVSTATEIVGRCLGHGTEPGTDVVAVDEAHFFGTPLTAVAGRLAAHGLTVIVAGLDVTFSGEPFEPLPSLMALAERVRKLTAICVVCGADAVFHVRLAPAESEASERAAEHVGGTEKYQARCRRHFEPVTGG